ncbi:MAG: tetratricopeptide repeat protein [Acidobacteriia bacterium]|nr:tetratricopeptide repeat protein [Terriglobia bacterium]
MLSTRRRVFRDVRHILALIAVCCAAIPSTDLPTENPQPALVKAQALEEQGLFEEAAKEYQAILKSTPNSQEAQLGLGRSLANQGRCELSADALRGLLQRQAEAETVVGICFFRSHELGQAVTYLERAVRLAPAAKAPRIYLSRAYAGSGRSDQAIANLKTWLVRNGDDAEVLYWIGKFYEESAQATFDRMAQAHPNSYLLYELQGAQDLDKKEYQKAVAAIQRALAVAPDAPGLHYWLGNAYWHLRSLDKAQTELETELRTNPYHAQANYLLGDILVTLRDPQKAIPFLERAVALNPGIWDAHRALGRALVMQNKLAEAIREFQIVADANPRDETIHGLLSNAYRRSGNMTMAMQEQKLFEKLSAERLERVRKPTVDEATSPPAQP